MKILNAQQIREADAHTIKNEHLDSIDLMERAAQAFCEWFDSYFDHKGKIAVFCGSGNNGGDALAIARILLSEGYEVDVFAVRTDKKTEDYEINEKRLKDIEDIFYISNDIDVLAIDDADIIIDGLFGIGLSKPITEGIYFDIIQVINNAKAIRVSIDIPSGLFADKASEGAIVNAHHTVTFQLPKLAFIFPENHSYVGDWHLVNIGLDKEYIERQECAISIIDEELISSIYKPRKKFSHKGDYGKCLLISGSFGKMGAAVLAAKAALRSGVGLLSVHTPRCGYGVLQTSVPEAMVSPDEDEKHFSSLPDIEKYDALGIGPGIGTDELTINAYAKLLSQWKKPMVIDADGLNMLAKNHHLLDMVPKSSILTPHLKEFERLVGSPYNSFDRLEALKKFAKERECFVLLKGNHTCIATPDGRLFINDTGNPGMATGGTGDVLTGIITALVAQKYNPEEAVILATYLHGLAGDIAMEYYGMESLIASDVIAHLPDAFGHIAALNSNLQVKSRNT